MSLLNLFKGVVERGQLIQHPTHLRAFNLGKIDNTEISIWLEVSGNKGEQQLTVKVKNEGNKPITNLILSVKTSSQIVIANRGEVFGTERNKEIIKQLPTKKSVIYSTAVKLYEDLNPAQIAVSISKNSKLRSQNTLSAYLRISPIPDQLGA